MILGKIPFLVHVTPLPVSTRVPRDSTLLESRNRGDHDERTKVEVDPGLEVLTQGKSGKHRGVRHLKEFTRSKRPIKLSEYLPNFRA